MLILRSGEAWGLLDPNGPDNQSPYVVIQILSLCDHPIWSYGLIKFGNLELFFKSFPLIDDVAKEIA